MRRTALVLALSLVAAACSPAVTDQRTLEPTPTVAPPTMSVSPPTVAPSATPLTTPASGPTPVPRKMTGRATLMTTGAGVAGVRVRVSALSQRDWRAPGPGGTATPSETGG